MPFIKIEKKIFCNIFNYRIRTKTQSTTVDGASEYKKCFRLFGAPKFDENNTTTMGEIRDEFEEAGRHEELESLESEIRDADPEFNLTDLSEIWETDVSLPRRIRGIVHLLALLGNVDFGTTATQRPSRATRFWRDTPHARFKSKLLHI